MWSFLEDAYRDVIEDNEDTDETDKVIKAEKDPLPQEEEEVWAIEEVKSENMSTTFEQLEEELQETAIAVDTIEFKDDMEFEVEIETETENQSTDVWSFYEQPQEDDDFVKCRLCSKYYKAIGGSTTNLLDHLKRAHPTCKVVSEANKKSKSCNGIRKRKNGLKYKRRTISEVWSYFEKTENGEYAKCCFCSRHYKTSGNTSNMFDHLKRTHPEFRKKMVRSDKGTPEEFFKKAAENNWNLFQKRY
uniref:BED zinc finger n=1 Tax=Musca domestica TaxID=7370 RepID=T1PMA9_MUSDO